MIDYIEKIIMVYLKFEKELIKFLNRRKIKGSKVMLCPCYNAVFEIEATKSLKNIKHRQPRKNMRDDKISQFSFNKKGFPYNKYQRASHYSRNQNKTYVPPTNVPLGEWIWPTGIPNIDQQKWKVIEVSVGSSYHDNYEVSKNYSSFQELVG